MTDTTNNENTQNAQTQAPHPQFELLRIYAKDSSIETSNSPACFTQPWKPELKVEFDSKITKLGEEAHEVALRLTVTCNSNGATAFICEVNQAATFLTRAIPENALEFLLNVSAPTIIFPYAREFISNLVNRATFPPLNLSPINFEAVYRARKQHQAKQAEQQNAANEEKPQA